MGSRVAVIAPPSLEAGGLRRQAGPGCGGACPAGRVAGASRVDVRRVSTRSTAERLLRTPSAVRSSCLLLCCGLAEDGFSAVAGRTRPGPPPRTAVGSGREAGGAISVADLERDDGDVRGDSVGVEVDRVDAAIVVGVGDDRWGVVVDPVLVLVGRDRDP